MSDSKEGMNNETEERKGRNNAFHQYYRYAFWSLFALFHSTCMPNIQHKYVNEKVSLCFSHFMTIVLWLTFEST